MEFEVITGGPVAVKQVMEFSILGGREYEKMKGRFWRNQETPTLRVRVIFMWRLIMQC